jgi:hypothetical protein
VAPQSIFLRALSQVSIIHNSSRIGLIENETARHLHRSQPPILLLRHVDESVVGSQNYTHTHWPCADAVNRVSEWDCITTVAL